jgi:hypothetical protein
VIYLFVAEVGKRVEEVVFAVVRGVMVWLESVVFKLKSKSESVNGELWCAEHGR